MPVGNTGDVLRTPVVDGGAPERALGGDGRPVAGWAIGHIESYA